MGIDEILNKLTPEQRAELQSKLSGPSIDVPRKMTSSGVFEKYTPPQGNSFYEMGLDDLCKEDIPIDAKMNKKQAKPKKAKKEPPLDKTTIRVDTMCKVCRESFQVTLADMVKENGMLTYTCEVCSE